MEEKCLGHLNRSFSNLRLGRLEDALDDAIKGTDPEAPSEKGLFRQARALYDMERYSECKAKFELLISSSPSNSEAKAELERTKERLHEQDTGEYSFTRMYRAAKNSPPLVDCATFSKLVEARPSPGRGNGLFTTRAVSAGELLLCEKAFAYADERQDQRILMNLHTKKMTIGGSALLIEDIAQKLYHNPHAMESFTDLYHGDFSSKSGMICDGVPVVDT